MTLDELLTTVNAKAKSFESNAFLEALTNVLPNFIPAMVSDCDSISDKAHVQLRKAFAQSRAYDFQLMALSKIKEIHMSHILGCNEMVAPVLVMEYAALKAALKSFEKAIDKLKQWEPAYKIALEMKALTSSQDVYDLLKQDLLRISDTVEDSINVMFYMDLFKKKSAEIKL